MRWGFDKPKAGVERYGNRIVAVDTQSYSFCVGVLGGLSEEEIAKCPAEATPPFGRSDDDSRNAQDGWSGLHKLAETQKLGGRIGQRIA